MHRQILVLCSQMFWISNIFIKIDYYLQLFWSCRSLPEKKSKLCMIWLCHFLGSSFSCFSGQVLLILLSFHMYKIRFSWSFQWFQFYFSTVKLVMMWCYMRIFYILECVRTLEQLACIATMDHSMPTHWILGGE